MIFKYHTFEIVPWGAILDIDCTSSSKKVGRVTNWISTTNYQTEYGYLGTNRSYFVESKAEPMSMTYSCTSKNGDLVAIQTNLSCTTSKNSSDIITSFTIDNTAWFNQTYTTESILISKNVQDTKIILNSNPRYPNNSNYTKFYINNSQIYKSDYEDKIFYFKASNAPVNSTIKATYTAVKEIEENNITVEEDNNSANYGRAYVSKTIYTSPISTHNNTKNVDITHYGYGYDSTRQKSYYYYRLNSNCAIGDKLKIKYQYTEDIEENHTAQEVIETTLHQGTITQYPNLTVEDYLDSNGNFVSCKRNGNIISLSTNTYDNKEIIVRYEKEKPYVKLCCNNVKIETVFLNSGGNYSNDFRSLTWDNTYLYPTGTASVSNIKGKLLRYITVHWNKTQSQRVYFGESFINTSLGHNDSHYMFLGGSDSYSKLGDGVHEHSTTTYSITTPAINSLSKPYYSVGYVVNFQGESWTPGSSRYINSPFTYYTDDGYIKSVTTGTEYDISGMPIPTVTKLEKWGDQSSFYVSNNYYVSPSDGLQLYTKWSSCGDYDPPCYEGCGQGCGQCGEGSGQVYAQNKYNGGATGDRAAQDSSGNYYRTGDMVFVSSGWYSVLGYCSGNPVIPGPIVLNYYSWDGSDY